MVLTEIYVSFMVATVLFAFLPGPAMLYVAVQTVTGNRWTGLLSVLGVHIGAYVHVIAAAAGLAILLHTVPVFYIGIKTTGAFYLIWLGIRMLWPKRLGELQLTANVARSPHALKSAKRVLCEGVFVEVFNPKTALFFLAFLPQFIQVSESVPNWVQFLILGTVVNMTFSLADVMTVLLAGGVVKVFSRFGKTQRWMQRLGAGVFVGLGVHLVLQQK